MKCLAVALTALALLVLASEAALSKPTTPPKSFTHDLLRSDRIDRRGMPPVDMASHLERAAKHRDRLQRRGVELRDGRRSAQDGDREHSRNTLHRDLRSEVGTMTIPYDRAAKMTSALADSVALDESSAHAPGSKAASR